MPCHSMGWPCPDAVKSSVKFHIGDALGKYGVPGGHAFAPDRQDAFWNQARKRRSRHRNRLDRPARET